MKSSVKRILALTMSLCLLAGVLAGCGPAVQPAGSGTGGASGTTPDSGTTSGGTTTPDSGTAPSGSGATPSGEDSGAGIPVDPITGPDNKTVEQIQETLVKVTGNSSADLAAQGKFYSDYSTPAEALEAGNDLHLQMTAEGQVLLKNEDGALPLGSDERRVTFLGIASIDFVTSGGGSGAAAQTSYGMDWVQGFEAEGFRVNPKTVELYRNIFAVEGGANNANDSGKLLEADMSYYSKSVVSTFAAYSDAAVVFISRFGRENMDTKTNSVPGHSNEDDHYLQLDDNELALIKLAKQHFDKVIVIINSSMIMQIPELQAARNTTYGVDAILWVGGVGDQGTLSAARIIDGTVNPSGHTVDIWPADFTKDPSFTNFSDMSQNKDENGNRMSSWFVYPDGSSTVYSSVEFREGIYMGYRFYETKSDDMNAASAGSGDTWYAQNVTYPFGFGLSYTTFAWELAGISADKTISAANQTITMKVRVTNTGKVAGKDVVQLYATTPYTKGGIEKASAVLVDYAKTKLLQPGESDVVTLQFVAQDMASFDWNDANGNGFLGYELEAGDYVISARRNSHEVVLAETYKIAAGIKCETDYVTGSKIEPAFVDDFDTTRESLLDNMISRANGLEQPKAQTAAERYLSEYEAAVLDAEETYYPYNDEEGQPWYVSEVPAGWTQYAPTTVTPAMLAGHNYTEPTVTDGKAVAATDTYSKLWDEYMNSLTWEQMITLVTAGGGGQDGPVRFGRTYATCWQSNPITAATFSKELVHEQGMLYANQGLLSGSYSWYAPGSNIHRSPFNGRVFEYFSEDPYVSAINAAIQTEAVVSKGIIPYAKHFFANVQEHNRADFGGVCTFATEQTFREIYMKSFEAMVKAGGCLMTSFNRIGYVVNSDNWAVHETILRGEWGFTGSTLTDAWCKDYCSLDLMVRAGDDVALNASPSFSKTYITVGQWDASARDGMGMIAVPTEDGTGTFLSPTQYYNVRKSAQRVVQSRVNSNMYKNFASDFELEATVYYGTTNSARILCADTTDFSVTLAAGQTLPLGLTATGFVVSYGNVIGQYKPGDPEYKTGRGVDNNIYCDYPAQGTYEVLVDMECDGYISAKNVKLTIHVVSPFQVDGEIVMGDAKTNPVISLAANKAANVVIDSDPFAYQSFVGSLQITNWYTKNGSRYLRDEEKTHADGTTIPYSEVEEKHEVSYTLTGDLPAGVTAEVIYGTAYGLRTNKPFEIVTGIRLVGTPTATGTYTVTVTANIPLCSAMAGIWLSPNKEITVTQTFTVEVR